MKTGDDRTVVHTSTNPVAHSNPLSSIPTDVSYDVLASPIDEIPPASPPPMTNRKSFARPTITSTEGVDLIEDSKHLDGFAPAITAPFQMDDQHSTSGSEERNETEVRRRQASATDLDDIVIRIETTKDAHRHHHAGDNVSVKSLSKQEYNVLKSRKEATLDYLESCNNIYGLKHLGSKPSDHRSQVFFTWIITLCIGLVVGAVGIGLRLINTHVSKHKWNVVYDYLAENDHWGAWGSFVGLSLCFAIPSAFIVIFISPPVGSSGIPDVKTYLNGSNIPNAFAVDTLILKLISMILTVLGPIPSGLQGPMIHVGATLGAWVGANFRKVVKRIFCCARQDEETRDEDDLPYYPNPVPSVTYAPGYKSLVEAVLAGAKVERVPADRVDYDALPSTGEETPFTAETSTSAPGSAAAPLGDTTAQSQPPLNLLQLPPLDVTTSTHSHDSNSNNLASSSNIPAPVSIPRLESSSSRHAPISLLRASTREFIPLSTLEKANSAMSDSPNMRSRMASKNNDSNSVHNLTVITDTEHHPLSSIATIPTTIPESQDGPSPSRDVNAHTPLNRTVAQTSSVAPVANVDANVRTNSSYVAYAAPVEATVDGDIVPVSSTGRSALFQQAGVIIPHMKEDITSDKHEFRKRANTRVDPRVTSIEMTQLDHVGIDRVASVGSNRDDITEPIPLYVDTRSQSAKKRLCPRFLRNIVVPSFSTDADRRDFLSIGCAAGMSASMGAPIGGVLYVLEEMGSYWSASLALRILAGSVLASVTAAFIGTAVNNVDRTGEFLPEYYATFFVGRRPAMYHVEEIPAFVAVGIFGGILGAGFTFVGENIAKFRANFYGKTVWRYAAFTLTALVVWCSILYALPYGFTCVKTTADYAIARAESVGAPADVYSVVRGHCEPGYHNPMSMLSFSRMDITVKRLLARNIPESFMPDVLAVWLVIIFFGSSLTSNIACTPGIILPFLMIGTTSGRLLGALFYNWFGYRDVTSVYFDPGVYATVGAAAFFAGATRTTLSMSILTLEITSDLNLLLPILIGAFTAHLVSGSLNETYYEVLIRLRKLPFLPTEPAFELSQMTAGQLMIRNPVKIGTVETVSHILDILESCSHNGFPVVMEPCTARHAHRMPSQVDNLRSPSEPTSPNDGTRSLLDGRTLQYGAAAHMGYRCNNTYVGLILRVHLLAIINRRVWRPDSKPFTPEDYERVLARAPPKISELRLRLSANDLAASVDLVPWINSSAYVVPDYMMGSRVFMLFRQLNLRHLPVVDVTRNVVGMITRLEMLESVVKHRYSLILKRQGYNLEHGGGDWREEWCQHRSALEQARLAMDSEHEKARREARKAKTPHS